MSVDTEGIAMFVHVALVVVGLMMATVLHTALFQLRGGAALAPASHALTSGVADADDHAVSHVLRRRTLDPRMWSGAHLITAVFFGKRRDRA